MSSDCVVCFSADQRGRPGVLFNVNNSNNNDDEEYDKHTHTHTHAQVQHRHTAGCLYDAFPVVFQRRKEEEEEERKEGEEGEKRKEGVREILIFKLNSSAEFSFDSSVCRLLSQEGEAGEEGEEGEKTEGEGGEGEREGKGERERESQRTSVRFGLLGLMFFKSFGFMWKMILICYHVCV